ncbi:MAG TPA: Ig-like domain-containing protein [Gemmatimonadales bacterium]|nr:Ig-like domain-containing protein [Gemmatimonadales bacterium]
MRRPLVIPVLLAAVIMAGCSERVTQQSSPKAGGGTIASVVSDDSLRILMGVLFLEGDAPRAEFDQMLVLLRRTEPPPDIPGAQALAAQIVNLTISLFKSGGLKNPSDPNLPQNVLTFGNGILELVGLPPGLTLASLDPDGAAAVITPESPNTTVLTETMFAGVQVNTGQVPTTTLITVTRLPNAPPPLLTTLAQFPFFYQYTSSPEVTFTSDVVVGVCQPNNIFIPNPSRLRLAHNIAPFTPGSIEILPLVNAPFLDCTLAQLSRAEFAAPILKELAALVTPTPLYATVATTGLGGTAKKFSPFGAVDNQATMDDRSPLNQTGITAGKPVPVTKLPKVLVRNALGVPMSGVTVVFSVTQGGGSVTGGTQVTNANGIARVGGWTTGTVAGVNALTATAILPAGAIVLKSPMVFKVTTRTGTK